MKAKLNNLLLKLARDQRGLSTVEYVVLLVLLVVMAVAVWNAFGSMLVTKLEQSGQEFEDQVVTQSNTTVGQVTDENNDWAAMRE